MIDSIPQFDESIEIVQLPADDIALELGSKKVANMVAIGAYLQKCGLFNPEAAADALPDVLASRYHATILVNTKALQRGAKFVQEQSG